MKEPEEDDELDEGDDDDEDYDYDEEDDDLYAEWNIRKVKFKDSS